MSDYDPNDISDEELAELEEQVAEERRREIAVEHLLFGTIRYVQKQHPGLLDELESSLSHLGDMADDETKDDERVREIARLFIQSLRAES
jgi:hypothetical protein